MSNIIPRRKTSDVWEYFDKDESTDEKKAICKYCFETYSYHTTITNLKQHLRQKHRDVCPTEFKKNKKGRIQSDRKTHSNMIWGYFTKVYGQRGIARCNVCNREKSYRTSITNLKQHLAHIHPDVNERYLQNLPPDFSEFNAKNIKNLDSSDSSEDDNIEDLQETQKLNEIWNYFEQEGSKTRCVVCRESVPDSDYEHLKAHLFENHPKLLLQLVQDQDERQDSKSNPVTDIEDNDNTYTEVVYLEQDSAPEDSRPIEKQKLTTPYTKRAKKRARNSTSSELPIKLKKEKFDRKEDLHQEDSELDAFIKYIRCLLKKLTPDVFSKVQVDILKTIMDAQYSQKVAVTDSGTSILTDIANGNVTNIIRVNEIAPENSSLLGNYTVTLSSKSDELNSSK